MWWSNREDPQLAYAQKRREPPGDQSAPVVRLAAVGMTTIVNDRHCRPRAALAVLWILGVGVLCLASGATVACAQSPATKIVGLGAATCVEFIDNVEKAPALQRDYLAWAQGFMSGILLSRPAGVDEGLDLNPPKFGMYKQLEFLRWHCATNRSGDFADAVVALYKMLRSQGTP